jgi:peptidoglycan/xylan/chitin deacetylase (PgdA/CDA1 family)
MAFVLVAVVAAAVGLRQLARSRTIQLFGELVPRIETSERVVALTFDDGPASEWLDEIVGALAARKVRSTFFVTGAELAAMPEGGRRLAAAGHELGNHTYSHARMVFKSPGFVRDEVERTDALIRGAGHQGPIYFRPPFCYKLVGLPWFLARSGRTSVTWDVEPDSYKDVAASASGIVSHVVERVRPGSIVLLHIWHESRETSRAAVPMIIDALQAKGYRFVTVSELVQHGGVRLRAMLSPTVHQGGL